MNGKRQEPQEKLWAIENDEMKEQEDNMCNKGYKGITLIVILIFFLSCTKTITYMAPQERSEISASKSIIVLLKDGTELKLERPSIAGEKIVGFIKGNVKKEIDFSLIQSVKIEKTNSYYAFLYGGVAIIAGILAVGAATAPEPPPSECCPFIFSFDGENYVFDAEPYGAAICQTLKRTEWCGLEHAKEINGHYKILIANELDETQYTDEVKLIVVDHPKGTQVAPNASGKIHSCSNPLPLIRAADGEGNDILPLVCGKDDKFWETQVEKKNPDKKEDLKDELIFELPKPKDAKKAKLFVNACTSLWGSQIAKQFLELHGSKIDEWYNEVNNFGPAYQQIMNWFFNEELYLLRIQVKTEKGWKSRGTIFGGGPFISEDKAYVIDIGDVTEETLKIKITPPATFWRINSLSVDYTEDLDLQIYEMRVLEALDNRGRDVKEILANSDNNYLIMTNKGDKAEVIFPAPPKKEGGERSVILKATGYYNIHLKAQGEPQNELLKKFYSEPGFTIRFALQEYLKSREAITGKR